MKKNRNLKKGELIAGEYEIVEVFGGAGKTGMGVVYLVKNREIPYPIVLKTYQDNSSSLSRKQFESEAKAWVNIGVHQNIVQAFWVRELDGQLFVSAEYVKPDEVGRNCLSNYLGGQFLDVAVVLVWAVQFCYAMEHALSKGLQVHRDIKPDNIMIDSNGVLKVTDFGLAKAYLVESHIDKKSWNPFKKDKKQNNTSHTKTGSMKGTLPYMAPEQFLNAKSVDSRADIYSFGIVLFQMVAANKLPYEFNFGRNSNVEDFYNVHANQKPAHFDTPLMRVINKCLQKDRNQRYQNYDELLYVG